MQPGSGAEVSDTLLSTKLETDRNSTVQAHFALFGLFVPPLKTQASRSSKFEDTQLQLLVKRQTSTNIVPTAHAHCVTFTRLGMRLSAQVQMLLSPLCGRQREKALVRMFFTPIRASCRQC